MKALWFRSALLAAALPACDDAATPSAPDAVGGSDAPLSETAAPGDDASAPEPDAGTPAEDALPPEDAATPAEDAVAPTDAATPADDAATPAEDAAPPADDAAVPEDTATPEDDTAAPADTATPAEDAGDGPDTDGVETVPLATLLEPFAGSANNFETTPMKRLEGLVVTLVKPTIGTETGGFFAQEGVFAPAVFVAAATLPPEVAPGATISLVAERLRNNAGLPQIEAFSGLVRTATGADLAPFRVNLDSTSDPDAMRPLVSRLMTVSGEIANAGAAGGGGQGGFWRFGVTTDGLTAPSPDVQLRLPRALVAETGLEQGCLFEVYDGAVWVFRSSGSGAPQVQPSVYTSDAFFAVCSPPTLTSAEATSPTTVELRFSRPLLASSVDAADFALSPTLAVEAAVLGADGRSVTLTTAEHSPGLDYTVTVVGDATDVLGEAFPDSGRSAPFTSAADTSLRAVFCFEDGAGNFVVTPSLAYGVTNARIERVRLGAVTPPDFVAGSPNWAADGSKKEPAECLAGDASVSRSKAHLLSGWSLDLDAPDADADAYYRVRFNAPAGRVRLAFDGYPSSSGPRRLGVWTSAANAFVGAWFDTALGWTDHPMYASVGGSAATEAGLSFVIPDSTTTPFEVRVYPFAASTAAGTFRLDNLTIRWEAP